MENKYDKIIEKCNDITKYISNGCIISMIIISSLISLYWKTNKINLSNITGIIVLSILLTIIISGYMYFFRKIKIPMFGGLIGRLFLLTFKLTICSYLMFLFPIIILYRTIQYFILKRKVNKNENKFKENIDLLNNERFFA